MKRFNDMKLFTKTSILLVTSKYCGYISLRYPNIEGGAFLIEALQQMGPFTYMQSGELTSQGWAEITAFCSCSDLIETTREAQLLHGLSQEFCEGHRRGVNPLGIEPMAE